MEAAADSTDFDCTLQKLKNYIKARLDLTKRFISDNRKNTSTKNDLRMTHNIANKIKTSTQKCCQPCQGFKNRPINRNKNAPK